MKMTYSLLNLGVFQSSFNEGESVAQQVCGVLIAVGGRAATFIGSGNHMRFTKKYVLKFIII